jgi:hypothetical protein
VLSLAKLETALVERVNAGFSAFIESRTQEEREEWSLQIDRSPEPLEPDDGYIRRDSTDHKHFFHFRSDLEHQLWKERGIRLENGEASWFEALQTLLALCSDAGLCLAKAMDAEPGFDFADRMKSLAHLHVIRILRYDAGYPSLARPHTDRCALTLHIAESHPGLKVRRRWETTVCESPKAPQTLVFPGQMLEHITMGGVPATWHGADDLSGTLLPRSVVVCFLKMRKDKKCFELPA